MPATTNTGDTTTLVTCGNDPSQAPCTLSDLFTVSNLFAEYVIKFFLPAVFFIGLFLTILPILKNPNSPENLADAKGRLIKLLIGTGIVIGAYMIVRVVLLALGVDSGSDVLQRAVGGTSFHIPFVEYAYGQTTPAPTTSSGKFNNPLSNVTIQSVISGIANVVLYLGVIGVIYGYIRSAIFFVMSQDNPNNLTKAKTWVFWTTAVALVIFGAEVIYNILVSTTNSLLPSK
jgi:hypothetical protein